MEDSKQFESRKKDHVRIALSSEVQTPHLSRLDQVQLVHEALPEINFSDVNLSTDLFGQSVASPFFISSMTAGHPQSHGINLALAKACEQKSWMMGVGSQRRELKDPEAAREWSEIRKQAPRAVLYGNLGLAQLIQTPLDHVQRLMDSLQASGFFIHTNPLQEALQPEGTPQFTGGLKALESLCKAVKIPVVLKEVGTGFSEKTLKRLENIGLAAVDVAGTGGTHWGRVELERSQGSSKVFENWGVSTVDSMMFAQRVHLKLPVWASGGVRSGLDAAKLLALGGQMVGVAQPFLVQALQDQNAISTLMSRFESELKIALFCTGSKTPKDLRGPGTWFWN